MSKAIDKAAGAEREVVGRRIRPDGAQRNYESWSDKEGTAAYGDYAAYSSVTAPATPAAAQWSGWGTALKPAFEPIVVARKPLVGTVAANVLEHGTGAINVDGCRIETTDNRSRHPGRKSGGSTWDLTARTEVNESHPAGRWPANVVLDDDQAAALDEQSGTSVSKRSARGAGKRETATYGVWGMADDDTRGHDDSGGASRFFYVAKAPKRERPVVDGVAHSTVKPLALMRWLVRLVTPPGGVVLDPFAGSGTTVEAALLEGFGAIGIEREADYHPMIQLRVRRALGL